MIRPVVGITVWKRRLSTSHGEADVLHAADDGYVQAVRRANAISILLPTTVPEDVPTMLDLVDGLVLTGGGDVSPTSYGAVNDGRSTAVSEHADAFELALIRVAEGLDMPVLGIGRGCQLLNVAFGGTLHQEITTADGAHRPVDGQSPDTLKAARHDINLASGSALAGLYRSEHRTVNTAHHQAIDAVADGFRAVATAPDGVVEAIEATGAWTAIGVQWHPELLEADQEAQLFQLFVDAVRSRIVEPGGVRFV